MNISDGRIFEPTRITGQKYGPKGLFTKNSFNARLPNNIKAALATAANHNISANTWKTYKSALNQLEKCQEFYNRVFHFPMNKEDVLIYVAWLLYEKKLKATTVEVYLSALRQVHLSKGHVVKELRPDIVKTVLGGQKNIDSLRKEESSNRLPVTLNMMKLIKIELNKIDGQKGFRQLVWAVVTLCFFGAFRIHELLAKQVTNFDPINTLLSEDFRIRTVRVGNEKVKMITVKVKSPKESRCVNNKLIDVYENNGPLCPVRACEKWLKYAPPMKKGLPMFRMADGTPLTGRKLNSVLRKIFKPHIPAGKGYVSSHSFRAGIASLMGSMGYGDEDIMAVGRWSSQCFERYIKLPRTKRLKMAREMGSWGL